MKRTLTAAALLLVACNEADHGHGHDHEEEPAVAPAPEPAAPAAAAEAGPIRGPLGAGEARLEASAEQLRLTLIGADGAPLPASGEAKVVLTGTGEEPQRVVLSAAEGAWVGPAKAAGAPGYVAVISVALNGNTETARLSWGEVPQVEAHGHGDHEHGDHEHGDHERGDHERGDHERGDHEHGEEADHDGDHAHEAAPADDRDHGHGR